jgi:hypothetical protein
VNGNGRIPEIDQDLNRLAFAAGREFEQRVFVKL